MVVDSGCLRHQARNLPANLMDAGLVTRMNFVRGRALLAEMVDLLLESGVSVDGLAMPDKQLHVCCFQLNAETQRTEKQAESLAQAVCMCQVLISIAVRALIALCRLRGEMCSSCIE